MTDDERDERAMDFLYGYVDETLRAGKFGAIDTFLEALDPLKLSGTIIVSVLIATLPASNLLSKRSSFIERSLPVLELEPEGADAVLHGLR